MVIQNPVNATQSGMQSITTGGVWNGRTLVGAGGIVVSNGDGILGNPTISGAAFGNVSGPGSSTDRSISTWNGTSGAALFNNSSVTISSAGVMKNTTQPCFNAVVTTAQSNVTGDGTVYKILYDTKIFDQTTSYDTSTGIFTAPVAGRYLFQCALTLADIGVAHTTLICNLLITSTVSVQVSRLNPAVIADSGAFSISGSIVCNMAASDTCIVQIAVLGSTKTVDVSAGGTTYNQFSGYLIC